MKRQYTRLTLTTEMIQTVKLYGISIAAKLYDLDARKLRHHIDKHNLDFATLPELQDNVVTLLKSNKSLFENRA